MQKTPTKYVNNAVIVGNSLVKDIELNNEKHFLSFTTKGKVKMILASHFPEIQDYDFKVNGFRNIDSRIEQQYDPIAHSLGDPMISIAPKILHSDSTVLVFAGDYLIFIDRTFLGNPMHLSAYNIKTLCQLETFKDQNSWDRLVFRFSDGKTLNFGAPNTMGLGGNPNKKIVKYLKEHNIIHDSVIS